MKIRISLDKEQVEDLIFSNRMSMMKPVIAEIARQYAIAAIRQARQAIKETGPVLRNFYRDPIKGMEEE